MTQSLFTKQSKCVFVELYFTFERFNNWYVTACSIVSQICSPVCVWIVIISCDQNIISQRIFLCLEMIELQFIFPLQDQRNHLSKQIFWIFLHNSRSFHCKSISIHVLQVHFYIFNYNCHIFEAIFNRYNLLKQPQNVLISFTFDLFKIISNMWNHHVPPFLDLWVFKVNTVRMNSNVTFLFSVIIHLTTPYAFIIQPQSKALSEHLIRFCFSSDRDGFVYSPAHHLAYWSFKSCLQKWNSLQW